MEVHLLAIQARVLLWVGLGWLVLGIGLGQGPTVVAFRAAIGAFAAMWIVGWLLRKVVAVIEERLVQDELDRQEVEATAAAKAATAAANAPKAAAPAATLAAAGAKASAAKAKTSKPVTKASGSTKPAKPATKPPVTTKTGRLRASAVRVIKPAGS